tara:strand:- start:2639 stop:3736 length:1098 start_codon:yes stop_codon:yes gene_type:complete
MEILDNKNKLIFSTTDSLIQKNKNKNISTESYKIRIGMLKLSGQLFSSTTKMSIQNNTIIHQDITSISDKSLYKIELIPKQINNVFPINFHFVFHNIPEELQKIFHDAGNNWSYYLTSRLNEPLVIHVYFKDMDIQTLAATSNMYMTLPGYRKLRDIITKFSISKLKIHQNMPYALPTVTTIKNMHSKPIIPVALLRSLSGFTINMIPQLKADAEMFLNSNITFADFNLKTIITHELGHVLGFVSCVDKVDDQLEHAIHLCPLDIFRFPKHNSPRNISEFSYLPRILHPTPKHHILSTTKTKHALATGAENGNGNQACHWHSDIGIMAPSIDKGSSFNIQAPDIIAMTTLGYGLTGKGVALLKDI